MTVLSRIRWMAPAALLLAVGVSSSLGAKPIDRTTAAARQRVRAEMIAAMADGEVTDGERRTILAAAEKAYSPEEMALLRQHYDRTSDDESTAVRSVADRAIADGERRLTTSSRVRIAAADPAEAGGTAEKAYYDLPDTPTPAPGAGNDGDEDENPFREERYPATQPLAIDDEASLMQDAGVILEDGFAMACNMQTLATEGWRHITFTASVDAFKSPVDLDNLNGNFGLQFGVNGGFPVAEPYGIGVQAGTNVVLSDFHGTQFTGSDTRAQNFTTVGLFQRGPMIAPRLSWGFAFDWLHDDYYANLSMAQWRVKLGYELSPFREIGIWANIPEHGDSALLGDNTTGFSLNHFRPVAQGNFYYRRCWGNGATTTAWLGIAEEPGQIVFGADALIPMTPRMSLFGNFNYILPSANGIPGQDEEIWNVSTGIAITLGPGANQCFDNRFAPFFPLATNGTFAMERF